MPLQRYHYNSFSDGHGSAVPEKGLPHSLSQDLPSASSLRSSLLHPQQQQQQQQEPSPRSRGKLRLALVGVLTLTFVGVLGVALRGPLVSSNGDGLDIVGGSGMQAATADKLSSSTATAELAGRAVSFTVTNSYTREQPITWIDKWAHLAEPFRTSTLEVQCSSGEEGGEPSTEACPTAADGAAYRWSIGSEWSSSGSSAVDYTFTSVGYQTVQVQQGQLVDGDAWSHSTTLTGEVMVKYVRREIRALTDDDRNRFLDALETMYRVDDSTGKQLFGPSYKPMSFFISMHLDGAGVKTCDGWHDDAGIVTNHVGVTLSVEQALQVIDPSVAIPYWDHTIDGELSTDGTLDKSPIFHANWFGNNNPVTEGGEGDNLPNHVVRQGRWAYTPVAADAWEAVHNPYGLLRSPWNTSPVPFLQRSVKTNGVTTFSPPTCSTFKDCFIRPSFAAMQNCLNGGTHGPVHILIGGEWGLGDEVNDLMMKLRMPGKHPLLFKTLWRMGFLRTAEDCSEGVPYSECRTSCPAEVLEANGLSSYDALQQSKALEWMAVSSSYIYYDEALGRFMYAGLEEDEAATAHMWTSILGVLCETGTVGEMYTSAAPQDPTFWILHPAMERFLGQKFLTADASWDPAWGYMHTSDVGDSGLVCDWSEVETEVELPTCVSGTCFGHGYDDIRPFSFEIDGETVRLTNGEILDLILPGSDSLPYMYDSYSWDQCDAIGIHFD